MLYHCLCLLIFNLVFSSVVFAGNKNSNRTILKANSIVGNKNSKKLTATGNVEAINPPYSLKADDAEYENKTISAFGKVIINNLEAGKVFAKQAKVSDDFKTGVFDSATNGAVSSYEEYEEQQTCAGIAFHSCRRSYALARDEVAWLR